MLASGLTIITNPIKRTLLFLRLQVGHAATEGVHDAGGKHACSGWLLVGYKQGNRAQIRPILRVGDTSVV